MTQKLDNISLGLVTMGEDYPCVIIAEGCDNHGGSLAKAKEMAQAAHEAGADVIKFQLHLPDEEMVLSEIEKVASGGMFEKWGSLYGFVEKFLLKPEEHAELKAYCEKIGIQYFCTPFSLKATYLLRDIGVKAFKIGSGETEDLLMLEEIAKMRLPMIISTGMTSLDELDMTMTSVRQFNKLVALMHCVSKYPVDDISLLHLSTIRFYRERYGVMVGWSDHSPPEGIYDLKLDRTFAEDEILAMVLAAGANCIEKHFTLDRHADDGDSFFSHDPKTLKNLVKNVRQCEAMLTTRSGVFEEEKDVRVWAKRSLVAACDIRQGSLLTRGMLTSKRPGTGIRSIDYKAVLGLVAWRDISNGEMLRWEDLIY
jgi:sialic acid synthase SpsE